MTPKIRDTKAAAHNILMVSSSKVCRTISIIVLGGLTIGSLVPNRELLHSLSCRLAEIPVYFKNNNTLRLVLRLFYKPI